MGSTLVMQGPCECRLNTDGLSCSPTELFELGRYDKTAIQCTFTHQSSLLTSTTNRLVGAQAKVHLLFSKSCVNLLLHFQKGTYFRNNLLSFCTPQTDNTNYRTDIQQVSFNPKLTPSTNTICAENQVTELIYRLTFPREKSVIPKELLFLAATHRKPT